MANTLNLGTDGNWGTKDGSLLGYNNENDNFKPLPFDFTRASSATRVNKQGLIETVASGVPRIDFTDANGALLLEPQRTNLIAYSESFSNAYWTKSGASITSNAAISPDGTLNADKLVEGTGTAVPIMTATLPTSSTGLHAQSFYVKADGRNFVAISNNSNGGSVFRCEFDLTTGTITWNGFGNTPTIEALADSWYKITGVNVSTTAGFGRNFSLEMSNVSVLSNTAVAYTGDGTSGIYIYGAQLEQGSYATSYIPTQGSAVTVVKDVCNNAGNDQVINSTEGVLYYESKVHSLTGDKAISVSTGSYNDSVSIGVYGGVFQSRIRKDGNYVHFISPSGVNLLNNNKIAILYSASSIKIFVNGVLKSNVSGVTYSAILSKISFTRADSVDFYYGEINDLRYYNTALTDQELIALTTI